MSHGIKEETLWIPIARLQDLPLREGRVLLCGDRDIAIFNLGDRVMAVDNRCPHKGGPIADGIVSGIAVVCPLHGRKFNLQTGEGIGALSASGCLETFRTRVQDDIVLLEFPPNELNKSHLPHTRPENLPCTEVDGTA